MASECGSHRQLRIFVVFSLRLFDILSFRSFLGVMIPRESVLCEKRLKIKNTFVAILLFLVLFLVMTLIMITERSWNYRLFLVRETVDFNRTHYAQLRKL
jgi:hypothetical protein